MDVPVDPLLVFRVKHRTVLSERHRRIIRQGVHDALDHAMATADLVVEDDGEYEAFIGCLQANIARAPLGKTSFTCIDMFGLSAFDIHLVIVPDDTLCPENAPRTPHRNSEMR